MIIHKGLACTDNAGLSCCGADGIVKKQTKKRKRGLFCKHQKQTHKQWWPSESPIHLFSCWVLVVSGRSRRFHWCLDAVVHAHFGTSWNANVHFSKCYISSSFCVDFIHVHQRLPKLLMYRDSLLHIFPSLLDNYKTIMWNNVIKKPKIFNWIQNAENIWYWFHVWKCKLHFLIHCKLYIGKDVLN